MIMVDSSVWIDYFNGVENEQTNFLNANLGIRPFASGDLILVEVLQGFKTERSVEKATNLFSELFYFDMLGKEIALQAADNYRLLRSQGLTIRKTIDIMIATFCIVNDFQLLHNDRDFEMAEKYLGLKRALV